MTRSGNFLFGALVLIASGLGASETTWWVADTAQELLGGRGDGVAVTVDGRLETVQRWRASVTLDEPVVLAVDRMPNGDLVVATGHPARLYRVRKGTAELMAELPGEQATAVLVAADGEVWASTVAPGALLRWNGRDIEEVARLGEGGFWDICEFDGAVIVAAGPPAALFRVTEAGLVRWLELPDDFVRTVTTDGDVLLAGTSGKGLVIRVDGNGRPSLLVDSPFTEISGLVVAADGMMWATALVGEPPVAPEAVSKSSTNGSENGAQTTAVSLDLDLPKVNGKTATSELVRITPEGGLLSVHRFPKQVATALAVDGDGVLVGTGFEGEVWRFGRDGGARLATVDAVQVTAFVSDGRALVTQGPAGVFERGEDPDHPPRFRSDAKEFPRPVRFGTYRVVPSGQETRIRFRGGGSSNPDPLWMPWTDFSSASEGPVNVELGRALQWEIELPEDGVVERVEVAWKEINQAPVIQAVVVEAPGVVYLSAPPPSGPVIFQAHPTFEGVFTTLGNKPRQSSNGSKGKKYYQVGFRTVSWVAADPNSDAMIFTLEMEREDGFRLPIRSRLEEEQLAIDTTAVPDGRYHFRLTASDAPVNSSGALEDVGLSRWITVDNSPPVIELRPGDDVWIIEVRDASPLAKVEMARDGERWTSLAPADGLLDGPEERFTVAKEPGRHLVVVRAFDRFHNRVVSGVEEGSE